MAQRRLLVFLRNICVLVALSWLSYELIYVRLQRRLSSSSTELLQLQLHSPEDRFQTPGVPCKRSDSLSLPPLPFPAHAFWTIGNTGLQTWRMVVSEQIQRIYQSRLVESMNITAMYGGPDNTTTPNFRDPRIKVEYAGTSDLFEWPALKKLRDYCKAEPTARVVYFHTKGASKSLDDYGGYNCYAWRKIMEHFTLDLHRTILLHELNDTSPYQVAGITKNYDHYSGNFWLAKCSWINTRSEIGTGDFLETDRMAAEFWIGQPNPQDFGDAAVSCWEPGEGQCKNFYECNVPEDEYISIETCGGKPLG